MIKYGLAALALLIGLVIVWNVFKTLFFYAVVIGVVAFVGYILLLRFTGGSKDAATT